MKQRVQSQADQQMQATMLAVYRGASDEELGKYVALLQSIPMQNFNQAFAKAIAKGMGIEAHEMGMSMKQLFDQMSAEKKSEGAAPAPATTTPPPPK